MKEKICIWIASLLPRKVLAHCIMRAWRLAERRYEALGVDEITWDMVVEFLDEGE